MPARELLDELQDSLADLLLSDADLSAPQSTHTVSSFPASSAMSLSGVGDDGLAEAEWRQSIKSDRDKTKGCDVSSYKRFSEKRMGILTDERTQQDVIENDLVLLKLKMPSYDIDETGFPVRFTLKLLYRRS